MDHDSCNAAWGTWPVAFGAADWRFAEGHGEHPQGVLVEESPLLRASLVDALEELAPVRVVGSAPDEAAATAWLACSDGVCDLVIIDIFLQRGCGLGVLRAASVLNRTIDLVVLSNYATSDMRRKCIELGASQVFDKSNEIEALVGYCCALASQRGGPG